MTIKEMRMRILFKCTECQRGDKKKALACSDVKCPLHGLYTAKNRNRNPENARKACAARMEKARHEPGGEEGGLCEFADGEG